jgi:acyl phosphate:glycerol-3-phosphate acyltransferase
MGAVAVVVAVVLSYCLGSVSFAVVVSRAMGLADPRSYGSHNPGATNVLRTGNKAAAALTLAGDFLKGFAAVFLVTQFAPRFGFGDGTIALSAVAVFCGHLFPVFHGFKGGKGVATAAGVLLGISGWLGLATIATWLIIAVFFRYSSLAALVSAIFAPIYYVMFRGTDEIALAVFTMSALLVWRHQKNIANLLAGREGRIGGKGAKGAKPVKTAKKAHH